MELVLPFTFGDLEGLRELILGIAIALVLRHVVQFLWLPWRIGKGRNQAHRWICSQALEGDGHGLGRSLGSRHHGRQGKRTISSILTSDVA